MCIECECMYVSSMHRKDYTRYDCTQNTFMYTCIVHVCIHHLYLFTHAYIMYTHSYFIHTSRIYIHTYTPFLQVITGSHDSTIKLYDLAAGKCMSTLTQHKKAVRGLCASHTDLTFTSVSGNIL